MHRGVQGNTNRRVWIPVDAARLRLAAIAYLGNVRIIYKSVVDDPAQNIKYNPSHSEVIGIADLSEALEQLAAAQLALCVKPNIWEWRDLQQIGLIQIK